MNAAAKRRNRAASRCDVMPSLPVFVSAHRPHLPRPSPPAQRQPWRVAGPLLAVPCPTRCPDVKWLARWKGHRRGKKTGNRRCQGGGHPGQVAWLWRGRRNRRVELRYVNSIVMDMGGRICERIGWEHPGWQQQGRAVVYPCSVQRV